MKLFKWQPFVELQPWFIRYGFFKLFGYSVMKYNSNESYFCIELYFLRIGLWRIKT